MRALADHLAAHLRKLAFEVRERRQGGERAGRVLFEGERFVAVRRKPDLGFGKR